MQSGQQQNTRPQTEEEKRAAYKKYLDALPLLTADNIVEEFKDLELNQADVENLIKVLSRCFTTMEVTLGDIHNFLSSIIPRITTPLI